MDATSRDSAKMMGMMTVPETENRRTKRPTMSDVAEAAGVSRALVSLVMNDSPSVSDTKRAAVLDAASRLGYRRNLIARNLAQQRTGTIGVVVNDLHNPFFSEVIDGIDSVAAGRELDVLLLNGSRDRDRERHCAETFIQLQVEGLVLIGTMLDETQLGSIAAHVPTTLVAGGAHPDVDSVQADDRRGAELAIAHLVELGHDRIVHIDGSPNPASASRSAGYSSAMEDRGLEPIVIAGGGDEAAAYDAVHQLLNDAKPATAIFAFNDLLAVGVLDRLDDADLAVPNDFSLVGYDNTFIAGLHYLSLTTVDQPRQEMGRLAAASLLQRVDDPTTPASKHHLEPTLIVRSSTAGPRR